MWVIPYLNALYNQSDQAKELDATFSTPWDILGSIWGNLQIQHPPQCGRAIVDCVVRMDAEWCVGHWHHVISDARNCLFWSLSALDFHRQSGIAEKLQNPKCKWWNMGTWRCFSNSCRTKYRRYKSNGTVPDLCFSATSQSNCLKSGRYALFFGVDCS